VAQIKLTLAETEAKEAHERVSRARTERKPTAELQALEKFESEAVIALTTAKTHADKQKRKADKAEIKTENLAKAERVLRGEKEKIDNLADLTNVVNTYISTKENKRQAKGKGSFNVITEGYSVKNGKHIALTIKPKQFPVSAPDLIATSRIAAEAGFRTTPPTFLIFSSHEFHAPLEKEAIDKGLAEINRMVQDKKQRYLLTLPSGANNTITNPAPVVTQNAPTLTTATAGQPPTVLPTISPSARALTSPTTQPQSIPTNTPATALTSTSSSSPAVTLPSSIPLKPDNAQDLKLEGLNKTLTGIIDQKTLLENENSRLEKEIAGMQDQLKAESAKLNPPEPSTPQQNFTSSNNNSNLDIAGLQTQLRDATNQRTTLSEHAQKLNQKIEETVNKITENIKQMETLNQQQQALNAQIVAQDKMNQPPPPMFTSFSNSNTSAAKRTSDPGATPREKDLVSPSSTRKIM